MLRATGTAGKARLVELLLWDAVLLAIVIGLVVADRLPRATQPAATQPAATQPAAAILPAKPTQAEEAPASKRETPRGPRRTGSGDGGLASVERSAREHLDAGRLDEAVAALAEAPAALRGTREHEELSRQVRASVSERARLLVAFPRVQALMDLGRTAGLESEITALPRGAEREQLFRELEVARKRARPAGGQGGGFKLDEFRPGWSKASGRGVTLESALPQAEARALLDALEGVVALAEEMGVRGPLELLVLDPDAPAPAGDPTATWRRAGEAPEALAARARWVAALRLAEAGKLGGCAPWVAAGLPAALATVATSRGARPDATGAGKAFRSLFLLDPLRGDGSDLAGLLQSGQGPDAVRAWAVCAFALSRDPPAAPLRRALEGALKPGPSPLSLPAGEASALERGCLSWMERP